MDEMTELDWLSDYVVGFMKSPTWVMPIAQFVDDRCELFDDDSEENKFEYTACHQEFGQLMGDLLMAHLMEVSVTVETFERFCQQGLNEKQELHRVLIEQLLAVDDFLTFKAMMAKQNAELYREVVCLDAECEPLSPAREVASQLVKDALDVSEWRLYEEQLFNPGYGTSQEFAGNNEEAVEAVRRCEEAELQHAIALSLQLEEERLRQGTENFAPTSIEPSQVPHSAGHMSAPLVSYVPLSLQLREGGAPAFEDPLLQEQALHPGGFISAPLAPLPHRSQPVQRLVRVEPLSQTASPADNLSATPQGQALRQRAERALAPLQTGPKPLSFQPLAPHLSHAIPLAPPPPPGVPANVALAAAAAGAPLAGGPTQEERQKRAEHLRNQRDRLLQKRRAERGEQLTQAIATGGRSAHVAAAVDRALQASGSTARGRRVVAELTPQPPAPLCPDPAAASAEQVRQALTVQLRQNLARSSANASTDGGLNNQLDRLEHLQAR